MNENVNKINSDFDVNKESISSNNSNQRQNERNERNFKYLDELIHEGCNEITLDSDIILGFGEELKYIAGIKINVDNITIDGNDHTIDAKNKASIFDITAKNIVIKNINLINGHHVEGGGAILNQKGAETDVHNCEFKNNIAKEGAAIGNFGKINLKDSKFYNNHGEVGSAISNRIGVANLVKCRFKGNISKLTGGAIFNLDQIYLKHSTFHNNFTKEFSGGAISNQENAFLDIFDCKFIDNGVRKQGGAITNWGRATMKKSLFNRNFTEEMEAGAIDNQTSGVMDIDDCIFKDNYAIQNGGAIINFGRITLNKSHFCNNSSKSFSGGAIACYSGSNLVCEDTTFKNNAGNLDGACIHNESENVKFIKCTFSKHQGSNIINNKKDLNLIDCTLSDNHDLDYIIENDTGSKLSLSGGGITDNDIRISGIYTKAEYCDITNTVFENNNSSEEYGGDIINENYLRLQSPKFIDDNSVLNKSHIDVKELPHSEMERIIKNIDGGDVSEFDLPNEDKSDFTHLNHLIDEENEISLQEDVILQDYELDFFGGGIEIYKDNVVINGNNHAIDGGNKTRMFVITGKNITLKNIVFRNGLVAKNFEEHTNGGGAIRIMKGGNLTIENCQFIDNTSQDNGGAILNDGVLNLTNNKFINNSSEFNGGAVYNNNQTIVGDNTFKNNKSKIAGAIYNNNKLVITDEMYLSGNVSDFKQPIYNAESVIFERTLKTMDESSLIYDTNPPDKHDWTSVNYLNEKLKESKSILLDKNIKIQYNDMDEFIINIDDDLVFDGNNHVIDMNGVGIAFKINSRVMIKNITLKNVYSNENSPFEINGNIEFENVTFLNSIITTNNNLINNNKEVKILDSRFYNNSGKNESFISNNGHLEIINTHFINNRADSPGTLIQNKADNKKLCLIEDSLFLSNFTKKNGGAIFVGASSTLESLNTRFIKNRSKIFGGAVSNSGKANLKDCYFENNFSESGGAIHNMVSSTLNLIRCDFNENTANENGGSILNWGKIDLKNNVFCRNAANYAGAIDNQKGGTVDASNTEFNKNTAKINYGAIFTAKNNDLKVDNCNFNGNEPNDI